MQLDPREFYLFTFNDAKGKPVPGGWEQPRQAFAYAKANQLAPYVVSGGHLVRVVESDVVIQREHACP